MTNFKIEFIWLKWQFVLNYEQQHNLNQNNFKEYKNIGLVLAEGVPKLFRLC